MRVKHAVFTTGTWARDRFARARRQPDSAFKTKVSGLAGRPRRDRFRARFRTLMCRSGRAPRLFYTTPELEDMGVRPGTVRRLVKEKRIRAKRVGRQLHLHPDDVEREVGWPEKSNKPAAPEPSRWAIREAEKLLS